ncbi:site-specific integrase [Nitrospirillum sp. BR 11752]|uniref:site-specific integrase n=1 Tax=Nitrospirillum sp. BR 11752 TaxID=3104293 RepID=UPI002EAA4B0B|nr:site-specific integrase [Nitrospirillum sp. BR 11752]
MRRLGHKPVSKTFEKRRDAERWATGVEADMDRRVHLDYSQADSTTLGALLQRYRESVTPTKRGANQEAGHLLVIGDDEICLRRLSDLSPRDIAEFRDRMLTSGYAPATVVRRVNLIATAIGHGRREWSIHMPSNPAEATLTARPKGADRKRERRLQDGEEEALLAGLAESKHGCWLAPMARLAIETAARQGEICALDWSDVDLDRRVMTVRGLSGAGSKNGEIRQVPLSTAAIAALRAFPTYGEKKGGPVVSVDQALLKVTFGRVVDRVGILDLTFHDLRHEATSRLAKIYTSLELMKITGHKTLSMLARYYHADAVELARRLD